MTEQTSTSRCPATSWEAARFYLGEKFLPIPVKPYTKKPFDPRTGQLLEAWQQLRLNAVDVDGYFPTATLCNVGLILGDPSQGLIDIDLDCEQSIQAAPYLLPKTGWISGRTSRPRSHYWYTTDAPPEQAAENFNDPDSSHLLELRSTGGQTVAPPGIHESGEAIVWYACDRPTHIPFATLRTAVLQLAAATLIARHWPTKGSRQNAALALAGGLLRGGWKAEDVDSFLRAVLAAAGDTATSQRLGVIASTQAKIDGGKKVKGWPSLAQLLAREGAEQNEAVVKQVRDWLGLQPTTKNKDRRASAATKLIEMTLAAGVQLFHTADSAPYVTIPYKSHLEHWPLKSTSFRRWLARLFYLAEKKGLGAQALTDALGVLEGQALFDYPEQRVHLRLAGHNGNIYLDLGNTTWQVAEITPSGWRILNESPVRFRRPKGMVALPLPQRGGSLNELRALVNVRTDADWVLLLAWLFGAFRPQGPFPALVLRGEQGTAKTTLGRLLRRLIDPSVTMLRSDPRDGRDLIIAANNGWVVAYDNLSMLPQWLSDALCRLATGGGFGTRQLYTDDEEMLFDATRPAMLTSITDVIESSDLLDRSIFLGLEPIDDEDRRTEEELKARFDAAHPRILAGLLDAISAGLRLFPTIRLDRLPRMADFALWAEACCQGVGLPAEAFLVAYEDNRAEVNSLALENSCVAAVLIRWLAESGDYEGPATVLLDHLTSQANETQRKQRSWPKQANHLTNHLRRLAPNLRKIGITLQFKKQGHARTRVVSLTRKTEASNSTTEESEPTTASSEPSANGPAHDPLDELATLLQNHNWHWHLCDYAPNHDAGQRSEQRLLELVHCCPPQAAEQLWTMLRPQSAQASPGLWQEVMGSGAQGEHPADGRERSRTLCGRSPSSAANINSSNDLAKSTSDADDHLQPFSDCSQPEKESALPQHSGQNGREPNDLSTQQEDGCKGSSALSADTNKPLASKELSADDQDRPHIVRPCPASSADRPQSVHTQRVEPSRGIPYEIIDNSAGLARVRAALSEGGLVALDVETSGLDPVRDRVRLLSLGIETVEGGQLAYLVDCFALNPAPLWDVLTDSTLVLHNALFDLAFLHRLAFTPGEAIHDTMLMSRLLYAGDRANHDLATCVQRELKRELDKQHQRSDWTGSLSPAQLEYAARDVTVLIPLYESLTKALTREELHSVGQLEGRCLPALLWLTTSGVAVDRQAWSSRIDRAEADGKRLKEEMTALAPVRPGEMFPAWNWDSTADMKALFHALGFRVADTNDQTLAALDHPLARLLRNYREAARRTTTYGRDWLEHIAADGRVYAKWNQLGSEAGRMSCASPNMQQLPRDPAYRRCIIAPPGRVLVKADYSQIELRIAAKVSGDKALLEAYLTGIDIHSQTAQRVLGKKDVSKEDRQLAKCLNFGLLYGMSPGGFRRYAQGEYGLQMTDAQAREYVNAFFRTYRGLEQWHQRVKKERVAETRTLAGRRRLMPKANPTWPAERQRSFEAAMDRQRLNTPVQGTGADGLKLALALLWERHHEIPGAFPVLVVHDEIVMECPETQAEVVKTLLRQVMIEAMAPLIAPVPVEAEVKIVPTWGG